MAPVVKDLLTFFHPNGGAIAITAGDGRIKIWDVQSGEMQTEFSDVAMTSVSGADIASNGHLSMDYTCMAWGSAPSPGSAKKKKKGGKEKGGTAVLVLGTGGGDLLGWDTTVGELKWRSTDCHSGGVKSLAFSNSGQRVYSAGNDGHVCELNSFSGQVLSKFRAAKIPLSCVAVSQDGGSVVAASAELKLFDLSSKKRLRKFPGHPANVRALCFTADGKYVLSCAVGERHVAMWQSDGGKADTGIVCSLSSEHPAITIDCSGFDKVGGVLRVSAVTEGGVAYVWSASTVAELGTAKPTIISSGITGKGSKSARPCILASRFLEDTLAVLVAHGSSANPQFERVLIGRDEGLTITLGTIATGALLPGVTADCKVRSAPQEVSVLGLDSAGEVMIPRPQIELSSAKKSLKKKRPAEAEEEEVQPSLTAAENMNVELQSENNKEALTLLEDEETMEEKLVALNLITNSHDEEPVGTDKPLVPRADSLQVLLSQALQADDNALLEQCLSINDEKVITNTVRRLQPSDASKFLTVSISKMEARPQRALGLVPWVRAVLLQHTSFIMSSSAMQPVITSLYQIIDARLSVFRPLLSLSGRLDLIMAQISANESQGKDVQGLDAVAVYEEDSDPEALDAMVDGDTEEEDEDVDDMDEDVDEDEPNGKAHGDGTGLSGEDSGEEEDV